MKKRIALLLCACLALSAAGCSAAPAETDPQGETTAPNVIITSPTQPYQDEVTEISQPMHALVMPTVSETTLSDDGAVLFSRSYQKIQLILNGADSADTIAADLQNRIGTTLANASQIESYAKDDYTGPEGWNPYFIDLTYTPTRIDRMAMCAFLGITQEMLEAEVPYTRVLAFNDRGRAVLKDAKKNGIFLNAGEPFDHPYWELEKRCGDLYGLFCTDRIEPPGIEASRRIYYHTPL